MCGRCYGSVRRRQSHTRRPVSDLTQFSCAAHDAHRGVGVLYPARRTALAMDGEGRADDDDSNPLGRERRVVPFRMGRSVPCARCYSHAAVSPHVGDRAPADLRVLVDCLRAIRAAHGETTLWADHRRRHCGGASGRPRVGASSRHPRRPRHAARARCGSAPDGLAVLAVYRRHAARHRTRTPRRCTVWPKDAIRSSGHCGGTASAASRSAGPPRIHERHITGLSV